MRRRPSPPILLFNRLRYSIANNGVRAAILHSGQRLIRSLRNHGLSGTFERAFRKAPTEYGQDVAVPTHVFDLVHGTDTSGFISGSSLYALSPYIVAYVGISPSALIPAIAALPIQHESFTFFDIGAGKGRALFVAAQFPFSRLLGVELDPDIADIARANISLNSDWAARISIVNQDAVTVTFPDGPLVLYLYNPFSEVVLRSLLANLERQLNQSARETYILYACNPHFDAIDRCPFLRQLSETEYPLSPEDAVILNTPYETFTVYRSTLTP